jgi:hypothetical protein
MGKIDDVSAKKVIELTANSAFCTGEYTSYCFQLYTPGDVHSQFFVTTNLIDFL